MDKCGVYQIWCNRTGSFYVGSSKFIYRRWTQHRTSLRRKTSNCVHLQNAWNAYGEECFRFSILEECGADELEQREQFYIDTLRPALNCLTDVKRRYGAEQRAKMAAAIRARAALITHCPHGHLYDEENTYRGKKGEKICRKCNAARVAIIYNSLSLEEREKALAYRKAHYDKNRTKYRPLQNAYAALHRKEKREYDRLHRAEAAARKRLARQNETPEQREKRLRMKRESARHCRERNTEWAFRPPI